MNKQIKRVGAFLLAVSGIAYLTSIIKKQANLAYQYKVLPPKVSIKKITTEEIDLNVEVPIYNPSGIDYTIQSVIFQMYFDSTQILKAYTYRRSNIPPYGTGFILLKIPYKFSNEGKALIKKALFNEIKTVKMVYDIHLVIAGFDVSIPYTQQMTWGEFVKQYIKKQ